MNAYVVAASGQALEIEGGPYFGAILPPNFACRARAARSLQIDLPALNKPTAFNPDGGQATIAAGARTNFDDREGRYGGGDVIAGCRRRAGTYART